MYADSQGKVMSMSDLMPIVLAQEKKNLLSVLCDFNNYNNSKKLSVETVTFFMLENNEDCEGISASVNYIMLASTDCTCCIQEAHQRSKAQCIHTHIMCAVCQMKC